MIRHSTSVVIMIKPGLEPSDACDTGPSFPFHVRCFTAVRDGKGLDLSMASSAVSNIVTSHAIIVFTHSDSSAEKGLMSSEFPNFVAHAR